MSFISILKKIGTTALGIEHLAAPVLNVFVPGFSKIDDIFQKLQSAVITVEQNNPVDGQGKVKSDAVIADFQSGLSLTQEILSLEGKMLSYDAAALQDAISSQVQAFNAMAALKASFKIVPKQ